MSPVVIQETEGPPLELRAVGEDDYCQSLLAVPRAEMWWFQTGLTKQHGFSRPFRDGDGQWWWRPKAQFSWPLNFYAPMERPPKLPFGRSLLGYQYPVAEAEANSRTRFNICEDLANYGMTRILPKRRSVVRKGLKYHRVTLLDPRDPSTVEAAREVWNSHVQRTSWNIPFDAATFAEHWRPLPDVAGTNVIGCYDPNNGHLCAWLIGRIVGGTAYVDTIASHTDRLNERPNDALVYAYVWNASKLPGVKRSNYFLRSNIESIENFKQAMGFSSDGIPSRTVVNPLIAAAVRRLKPELWRRLHGEIDPPAAEPGKE